ncbi:MAG: Cys-tRNA(Pro) deacylase [Chloroflexaceae bacterium]
MAKPDYPITPAVRYLRRHNIAFQPWLYPYEDQGGTGHAAMSLQVDEHAVIKTLVMESDARRPLLMLMHGDREVSTKQLARQIGVKTVGPCDQAQVQKSTGYIVGGVSPFGTRQELPIYVEATILDLERIYINGGKRGFLVEISPADLQRVLPVQAVTVAVER